MPHSELFSVVYLLFAQALLFKQCDAVIIKFNERKHQQITGFFVLFTLAHKEQSVHKENDKWNIAFSVFQIAAAQSVSIQVAFHYTEEPGDPELHICN